MDQTDAFWTPRAIVVLEVSLALSTTTASVHVVCEQASSVTAGLVMPREAVACHRDRLPFQFAPLPEPRQSTISRDGRRLVGPVWCLLSALPKGAPAVCARNPQHAGIPTVRKPQGTRQDPSLGAPFHGGPISTPSHIPCIDSISVF